MKRRDVQFFGSKLADTIIHLSNLFCARTFGKYVNSGWDGSISYARYAWHGREWIFPLGHVETVFGSNVAVLPPRNKLMEDMDDAELAVEFRRRQTRMYECIRLQEERALKRRWAE
jgi:hypothetical protein